MKNQNPFKQKLYSHTVPVRDELWERIESNLPSPKKRFPIVWTSLIGGLFLTSALVIGISSKEDHSKTIDDGKGKNVREFTSPTITSGQDAFVNKTGTADLTQAKVSETTTPSDYNTSSKTFRSTTHTTPFNSSADNIIIVSDRNAGLVIDAIPSAVSRYGKMARLQHFMKGPLKQQDDRPDMSQIKPDPSCYRFSGNNGKNLLSIDLFAGPGFSPRMFEDTGGESSLYAIGREATEKSQYAWAAGARVNLNLKEGLAVRLGLMYEQIGDVFDYTDTSAFQISTRIDSFFAPDGTFLYTETNTVTILGSLIKKIHNRYTHVDVPLLLSYELPLGRAAAIMVNAGPVINLTSSRRGQILDPTLVPKHITPGERDELKAYKNNVGLSVYLGVGALFPLTDHISALIEPRFLYRINPVTLDTYPLKEHRHYAGLNLGIRYHLN